MGWTVTSLLPKPLKSLAIRFDRSPIRSVEMLADFVSTRSSYVAQTSLYGYLKARMGTKFPSYFEDDLFSVSIRKASAHLFVSCLGDMTVFSVAIASNDARLEASEATELARYCFKFGVERMLTDLDPELIPADALTNFDNRILETEWTIAAERTHAFAGSESDLIRFAPVIDEFKKLDEEIVTNSIRFRWRDIREQLRRRIDEENVCSDWRNVVASSASVQT